MYDGGGVFITILTIPFPRALRRRLSRIFDLSLPPLTCE